MTKDERFLTELYKAALQSGDPEGVVNPHPIAKRLGYKANLVKEILKGLCKANFIIAYSPEELALTDGGRALARSLLGQ